MRGFSKAIVTGNLTRDPELRTTPNGASVCSFSVAVNRVYRDASGEQKEDVSFIDCSAWGKLGEMINQYAKKVPVCSFLAASTNAASKAKTASNVPASKSWSKISTLPALPAPTVARIARAHLRSKPRSQTKSQRVILI